MKKLKAAITAEALSTVAEISAGSFMDSIRELAERPTSGRQPD